MTTGTVWTEDLSLDALLTLRKSILAKGRKMNEWDWERVKQIEKALAART